MPGPLDERESVMRVASRREAADGVVVLEFESAARTQLPDWQPGAHIEIELEPGLVRQYSLCGSPNDSARWRVGVLREMQGRGGSSRVHETLLPGTDVLIRGPRNHFVLAPSPRYVFIAGGIGITPILPMVQQASRHNADWNLFYGGRSLRTMAFLEEISALDDGRVVIQPEDESGLLDLEAILGEPREGTLVYVCGPEPLLLAVEKAMMSWPEASLHVERFAPKEIDRAAVANEFVVELADSGLAVTVRPDQSILQAVTDAGVNVWSSCQEGICGTCETEVLSGAPDHRDVVLTGQERAAGQTMMICVSRALSPSLVLKL